MIVTKKKDISTIVDALDGRKRVHLFGCNACAEQCYTGGRRELDEMKETLERRGVEVTGTSLVDETCYRQRIGMELRKREEIRGAEAMVVLACGAGVRTVADVCDERVPVIPALDTLFLASVERHGRFHEGCSLCGECVLDRTASICPHTECPKGLLNGPCGGVADGMCEVNMEMECAWVRIYRRLRRQRRLHLMRTPIPPKDHSTDVRPRKVFLRH